MTKILNKNMKKLKNGILNWISNKHWEDTKAKPHYFCYRHHFVASDFKTGNIHRGWDIKLFGIKVFTKYKLLN